MSESFTSGPGTFASGKHRLTAKYIPIKFVTYLKQWVWGMLIVIIGLINSVSKALPSVPMIVWILAAALAFIIPCTLVAVIAYKRFSWEITDEELHIYKGIITKKQLHVPYKRVHSADINAPLMCRVLGVVTLNLDTAGGVAGKADVQIPALEEPLAKAIKDEVFRRKRLAEGAPLTDTDKDIAASFDRMNAQVMEDAAAYSDRDALGRVNFTNEGAVYRLSVKELILAGISSGSTLLVAFVAFSALSQIFGILGRSEMDMYAWMGDMMSSLVRQGALAVIGFVLIVMVLIALFAIVSKVMTLWGFTVVRNGRNIEIKRGLLEKNSSMVAVERIQAVQIQQGVIRKLIGYAEIKVERVSVSASGSSANANLTRNVIHPFIKVSKVDEFIAGVLPEYSGVPKEETLVRTNGDARRRSFIRHYRNLFIWELLPAFIACVLLLKFAGDWEYSMVFVKALACLSVLLIVWCSVLAQLAWEHRAIGFDDDMLVMRSGAVTKTLKYIPRRKIQFASYRKNPFQARWSLATLEVHSASLTMRIASTIDVDESYALAYLEWVKTYRPESVLDKWLQFAPKQSSWRTQLKDMRLGEQLIRYGFD